MRSMRRTRIVSLSVAALILLASTSFGVLAQGGPPPPDATPGAIGFQGSVLAAIDTSVAPGYRLVLAESVFEPGAYVTSHTHPTAIVVCVQSGALGFALQRGSGIVTRGAGAGTPPATESLGVDQEIVLQPRDCVSFDHFAQHTAHTGWNVSDGQTLLIEARLIKTGEPFTTFINSQGTPVAP